MYRKSDTPQAPSESFPADTLVLLLRKPEPSSSSAGSPFLSFFKKTLPLGVSLLTGYAFGTLAYAVAWTACLLAEAGSVAPEHERPSSSIETLGTQHRARP